MQCCLPRESKKIVTEPGDWMFLDLANLNFTTMGGNRNIGLLVDEYSRLKFNMYISTKSQLQEQVLELLKIIFINFKIKVQVLRMDNKGENIHIKNGIQSNPVLCEMGTIVEYTAPYTPQQNGKVERAFPTLFGRARAACNRAKLPVELRKKLFCEAFRDAVQKDAILLTRGREIGPPYNAFFGKNALYIDNLHPFGGI